MWSVPIATLSCLASLNSTCRVELLGGLQPPWPILRHVELFSCTSSTWAYVLLSQVRSEELLPLAKQEQNCLTKTHKQNAGKSTHAERSRVL